MPAAGIDKDFRRGMGLRTAPADKIKVFHVLECGDLTGCSRLVASICNGLDPAQFETAVIYALRSGATKDAFESQFAPHVRKIHLPDMVRPIFPRKDLAALMELNRIFSREKPDAVHLHSSKAGFLGRFAARWANVPRIFYSSHGYSFRMTDASYPARALYFSLELMASQVGEVLVNAPNELGIAKKFAGARAHPCYNAIAVSAFTPRYPDPDEPAPLIAACGRITAAKNPEAFLRLCAKLAARYPSARFKWIGAMQTEKDGLRFQDMILKLDLDEKMVLTGWLPPRQAQDEARSCDIIIHYSKWDVLPTAVLEAMALGKPVIGSAAVDQIIDGKTGYVVFDENALFERACWLWDSGALRASMGRAARAAVEQNYDLPGLISRLEKFYTGTS
ncbi:MAG TPA: glycosyltransferase [Elusimicrobiota bacterium]|nr:glycosyltransferase [Elusimicrobiota bacterium]